MSFESFIDKQIQKAIERGALEMGEGAGKPLELPDHHDENWWAKQLLRKENLSYVPPALALRREVANARAEALAAPTEARARRILEAINEQIREALRRPVFTGPAVDVGLLDVEAILRQRRDAVGPG